MALSQKQQRILGLLARPAPPVKGKRGALIPQRYYVYRGRRTEKFFLTYTAGEVYEPHDVEELRASGFIEAAWPGTESENDAFVITDRGRATVGR